MKKNNKSSSDPMEIIVFDFGKKIYETKGTQKKVFKDIEEFKKKKVF
jgi:hypothetical protein